MTHTKFLMRRLAYVPWLLAVGLVLGWSGEAVADGPETDGSEPNHSGVMGHSHATDPYLRVSVTEAADSVFVNWSTSYGKNFHTAARNGLAATSYTAAIFPGEVPDDPTAGSLVPVSGTAGTARTAETVMVHSDTLTPGDPLMGGFYWVRMTVLTTDEDGSGTVASTFTKQIAVNSDYMLSVSPTSVREDADPTNIVVKATVDEAVTADTFVPLRFGSNQEGVNSRFRMTLPTLTISQGSKEATGTIRFIPVESTTTPDDDILVRLVTQVGGGKVEGTTDIRLVDADKGSNFINLSFSDASLNKRDAATDIVVTATLDGKPLDEDVRFILTIDKDYERDNPDRAAVRDDHYIARMSPITIRRGRVSGRATISISPRNVDTITDTRSFRVIASNPDGRVMVGTGANAPTVMVNGALIDITGDPTGSITGLSATPFSIREDAGSKEVTLEVTLQNASPTDETVRFNFEDGADAALGGGFKDAIEAERDNHYHVRVQPLVIPQGQKKGMTTMTVTVADDQDGNKARAFTVIAWVGSDKYETGILITDDDSTSESITLEVSPAEISENAGPTTVTVTGILHGKAFGADVVVPLIIDTNPKDMDAAGKEVDVVEATRDLDYRATLNQLTIPSGSTVGTTMITITPATDSNAQEGDEKIRLKGLGNPEAKDEYGDVVALTVTSVDITLKDSAAPDTQPETPSQDPTRPYFAADAKIDDQVYTAGMAIDPLVLPAAMGDDTPFMYNVFSLGLPAGLSFDPATRTLSGTPTAATDGPITAIYTVVDSDGDAGVPLTFSITVNAAEMLAPVIDAEMTATPSLIREDAGTTQVSLTVSLTAAQDTDQRITVTIVAPSAGTEGKPAVRDVDYDATLGAVITIPAGATVGMSTLTLTPRNNTRVDGLKAIGVQATFTSGATILTDIEISDDETPSTSIALSVNPHQLSEDAGTTDVAVTATLDGEALAEDTIVSLIVGNASTAVRDVDYAADFTPLIEIPAGSTIGVTLLTLRPIADNMEEGNEIIKLVGMIGGLVGDEAEIVLIDQDMAPMDPMDPEDPMDPMDGSLAFASDADIADQSYAIGTAIDPLMLPAASGGTGARTYRLVGLPAGLSFDGATRTLSGTPTTATGGAAVVTYIVTDEGGAAAVLTFSITVNGGMSMAFGFADNTMIPDQSYTAGTAIAPLVLPAASGGTGVLTYRLVGLPAGLSFDGATRTIAGMPTAATSGAVEVSYIVTDEGGSIAFLTFSITVNAALSFGDLFGAGKIVPTDSHDLAEIREFVVGQRVEGLTLPEGTGGTAPLTYSLSPALPVGLTFDAATRTIAGTPMAASEAVYTYTVTDANGATASLALQTLPAAFSLADNYPNPFNPATTIQYALPQAADVELTVYNVVGQPVRTLVAEHQNAGRYVVEWDATNDSGHSLSSGMYLYRLQAGGEFLEVKKMLLLK